MDIKFNSLDELYQRLTPALNSKVREITRSKINYIKKEDIWNYLEDKKWTHSNNLTLADMVDDILNCNSFELDQYVKNRVKDQTVKAEFDNLNNLL